MTSIDYYLKEIDKYPIISSTRQSDLAVQAQHGDAAAKDLLTRSNLRFVVSIAKQYQGQGLPLEDIIAEGNVGILNAIESFDPSKAKFLTYAGWWIRKSIIEAITENNRSVRIPANRVSLLKAFQAAEAELYHELERKPADHEVLSHMDVTAFDIVHQYTVSLDGQVGHDEDARNLYDFIINPNDHTDQPVLDEALSQELRLALNYLLPREAEILRLLYGFDTDRPYTLEEIGRKLMLTRERVRQLKHKGLKNLRRVARRGKLNGIQP